MSMIGLTPAELDAARVDFDAQVLPDRCDLRRPAGGTFADVPGGQGLPCRLGPVAGRDVLALGDTASRLEADAVLRVAHDAPIRLGDHARVGGARCVIVWIHPVTRIHQTALVRIEGSG